MASKVAQQIARRPWPVLAGWLLLAALGAALVTPLEQVIARDATSFVPTDAASIQAFQAMDRDFGSGRAKSAAVLVLHRTGGLTDADRAYYDEFLDRVRQHTSDVAEVADAGGDPKVRALYASTDGEALYAPIALTGPPGSPLAGRQVRWLRDAAAADKPAGLEAHVTGQVATIADFNAAIDDSVLRTTFLGVGIVIVVLLLVYRNLLTPLVPLATIGIALGCSRAAVAALSEHGLPVSTYTPSFLTAIVLGAGTDYAVFLIARHRSALRAQQAGRDAAARSLTDLAPVLVASAATVIIGSACMVLAKLSLFRTTGPALAVAVAVTLLVSLTLTPALLALLGTRLAPRAGTADASRRWTRFAGLVAARPARALVAGLAPLLLLAAFYPTFDPAYDESRNQSQQDDSALGAKALDKHYPAGTLLPDYLLVTSKRDLRDGDSLAALDAMTGALNKVPGVTSTSGLTRPLGKPIPQASVAYVADAVADRLSAARTQVAAAAAGTGKLAAGAQQASNGATRLAAGLDQASTAADALTDGAGRLAPGLTSATTGARAARDGAVALHSGAARLATGLDDAHGQTQKAVDGLRQVYDALSADPLCSNDPVCVRSRDGLHEVYVGERDRLVPGLRSAATGAHKLSTGGGALADGLSELVTGLTSAETGAGRLRDGTGELRNGLDELLIGAGALADGTARISSGAGGAARGASALTSGLAQATSALDAAAAQGSPGFYLPAGAIDSERFAVARKVFLSPDGHTARVLVYSAQNPYGPEAMQRAKQVRAAAATALRGTALEDAHLQLAGAAAVDNDIAHASSDDFRLVVLAVLAAVLLILFALLRSLVAPLYLLASVVLSYAAAMGGTVLFWQHLLHHPVDWTVPMLTFIILVAVGADYNILLTTRIRDAAHPDTRAGVATALASTGSVITSAGLIFAGSFAALLAAGLGNLVQTGFAIAVGLILDTFVVRSLIVPAATALLGERAWWPRTAAGSG